MSKEKGKFKFTYDWFKYFIPDWENFLSHLKNQKINVLEIGAFEGRSTTWILEELFNNPESKLISVDPFDDTFLDVKNYEATFHENVKITGKEKQNEVMKSLSSDALIKLNYESKIKFDFIFIDGSHVANDVLVDAVLAWNLLKEGGIIIFDDYELERYEEEYNNAKVAVDSFLKCYEPQIEVIHKGFQVIVKKINREKSQKQREDFFERIKRVFWDL
ncbi:SAM-dependent methyltransferase [Gigaspora margarita]|uniref:SAM-dependent methyltransferase n=1 Tax=Gigaspora margarita TaxID=4874 RepID=A0A8H3X547_GIGMA|nr:SAM-dependent methyltransferase [Gigaspora margarita]